eukprot:TRINITY_DN41154_c0_g1_i1.p1 TRINITY_DN41154_c0_g1~~TRINITY_DN41154_c0_g1_i1.p1  ORF type:complete len:201 (+),score=2.79 TRINITY_DN41154_c0_g1_i1:52-603(+)
MTRTLTGIQTHVTYDHPSKTVTIDEASKVPLLSSDGCTSYLASVLDLAHRAQECITLEWSRLDTAGTDQAASSQWNTASVARVFDVIAQWLLRASYWVSVGGDAEVFKTALTVRSPSPRSLCLSPLSHSRSRTLPPTHCLLALIIIILIPLAIMIGTTYIHLPCRRCIKHLTSTGTGPIVGGD